MYCLLNLSRFCQYKNTEGGGNNNKSDYFIKTKYRAEENSDDYGGGMRDKST